ncbi:MAG: DnaD domain protein [Lachnospirales bacterium]
MNNYFSFVPIYNLFIEKYMIKSNPSFVIIYIYILKKSINSEDINLEDLSKELNILASDIIKALEYWQSQNIISYKQINNKVEVIFFEIKEQNLQNNRDKKQELDNKDKIYTDEEVTIYSQKEEIQQLFRLAEKKLAKTLTYQDRKILIALYENYGMSLEILAILFTYCIENGKNNLNYIEKVAIDWCENNIDSLEKVETYLKVYNSDFKTIMKFFGILNRAPIKKEEDFMKKWILDYKMPMSVIEEACARTVITTGKASFEYASSIIERWKERNVKSLEDIKNLDNEYENYIKSKKEEKQKRVEQVFKPNIKNNYGKNKFVNYKQEPLDYELLRKIEIMALKEGIEDND